MNINFQRFKKPILTLVKIAGVFFILGIIAFFSFRNLVLHKVLDKVSQKFRNDYQTTFTVDEASFKGLTGIELNRVSIVPDGKDTLVRIGVLQSSVRFWYALILDFRIKEVILKDGYLNFVKNDEGKNFDAFLHKKDKDTLNEETENQNTNYAKVAYKLISKVLVQVPNEVLIENFALKIDDNGNRNSFNMQQFSLHDEKLETGIEVVTNTFTQHWKIEGSASPKHKTAVVQFYNLDTGKVKIPYVDERFHIVTGFDSIRLNLASIEIDGDELQVTGSASVVNFLVNHPKISKKDVVIEKAEFNYKYLIGQNFISVDSNSTVTFNSIHFHPYIKYQISPDKEYSLGLNIEKTPAQDFINSLPEGLFTHFKGMEAEGNFSYSLRFSYNEGKPNDLLFDVDFKKENLKIIKFGEANLSKLNGEFVYVPMEKGRPQRSIMVGMENPNYTPLDQISPFMQKCVLTSEDPSFFYHRGFIDEAFRQSIIKNIKTKKFARGASTISMQLVKNVFLTREKTLSRKLEEILLVYILENNHLSTKDRMFEVYLNIIEWGPNVYGIGEASQFYFKKRPSELNLNECLFLTTIIPRPKGFMWRFGKDGFQKEFVGRQYHFLSELMVRRNLLLPEDTIGLNHRISITGPAKSLIIKSDTLINDSVIFDENGLMREEPTE